LLLWATALLVLVLVVARHWDPSRATFSPIRRDEDDDEDEDVAPG